MCIAAYHRLPGPHTAVHAYHSYFITLILTTIMHHWSFSSTITSYFSLSYSHCPAVFSACHTPPFLTFKSQFKCHLKEAFSGHPKEVAYQSFWHIILHYFQNTLHYLLFEHLFMVCLSSEL